LVEWASDQYRSAERSLKIYDSDGDDDPCWVSGNLAKLNWNSPTGLGKNIEMLVGGWVKTENVNTSPADAANEIRLTFSFFDAEQNLIFGEPVVLKVPQTQASVDWTEIKNDVPIVLPVEADSLVVMFSFGANATGTAWLDDIFMYPAPEPAAGSAISSMPILVSRRLVLLEEPDERGSRRQGRGFDHRDLCAQRQVFAARRRR
jgi:hypothetical protein